MSLGSVVDRGDGLCGVIFFFRVSVSSQMAVVVLVDAYFCASQPKIRGNRISFSHVLQVDLSSEMSNLIFVLI